MRQGVTRRAGLSALVLLLGLAVVLSITQHRRAEALEQANDRLAQQVGDLRDAVTTMSQTVKDTRATVRSLSDFRPSALKPSTSIDRDIIDISPILSGGGTFNLVGEGTKPKEIMVGHIQPMLLGPDPTAPPSTFKNLMLFAARGTDSRIGGTAPNAPPGAVPAPIVIDDCDVDVAIRLGDNVTLGRNVRWGKSAIFIPPHP